MSICMNTLLLDGDDVYFEAVGDARRTGGGARSRRGRQPRDLVPAGAGVRARLPRRHLGPARLRQLDEPQRPREPAPRRRTTCSRSSTTWKSSARTSSVSRWADGPRWGSQSHTAIACGASCSPTRSAGIAIDGWWNAAASIPPRVGAVQPPRTRERVLHSQSRTRAPVPADRRPPSRSARRPVRDAEEPGRGHASPTNSSPQSTCRRCSSSAADDEIFPPALIVEAAAPGAGRAGRADRRRRPFAVFRAAGRVECPGPGLLGIPRT